MRGVGRVPPARHAPPPTVLVLRCVSQCTGFNNFNCKISCVQLGANFLEKAKSSTNEIEDNWNYLVANWEQNLTILKTTEIIWSQTGENSNEIEEIWNYLIANWEQIPTKLKKTEIIWSQTGNKFQRNWRKLKLFGRKLGTNSNEIKEFWNYLVANWEQNSTKLKKTEIIRLQTGSKFQRNWRGLNLFGRKLGTNSTKKCQNFIKTGTCPYRNCIEIFVKRTKWNSMISLILWISILQ